MEELAKRIKDLEALLLAALGRIAELEGKTKQNSGNSSKSPSSDMGRKRKPPVEPSGRKPGGQLGHDGQTRTQAPAEERMLTLVGTARKRSIDLLDWLTRAIQADLEGRAAPAFQG